MGAQSKNKARSAKTTKAAAKKAKKSTKKKDEWDSDLEPSDDDFVVAKPAPRARAAPKKPAPKPPVETISSASAIDEAVAVLEKLSINEHQNATELAAPAQRIVEDKSGAVAKPAEEAPPKAVTNVPAKKVPAKKSHSSGDDTDDFMGDSDADDEAPAKFVKKAPPKAAKKVAAKKAPSK